MKDSSDKYTEDMYVDFDATEERLDQAVKELVWDSLQKKFVPYSCASGVRQRLYPYRVEDKPDE